MDLKYFLSLSLVAMSLSLPGFAQRPEPRMRGPVTGRNRIVLQHSRTPLALETEDIGKVALEMKVPGITIVFRRSEMQEASLKDLLAEQQDPGSPLFHRWLTPEEFASRFGVADEDIAATEQWLTSQGFHVDSVARSRDRITFSGTAAQVQVAFGTELHRFRIGGEIHFATAADLSLPAELIPMTAAVLHLSDFRPKPNVSVREIVQPNFTASSTQAHYLTPKDIAIMYNVTPSHLSGTGQGLAVVGQSYVSLNTSVSTFQGNLALPNPITPVLVPNSGAEIVSPGDVGESELDLEYASAIAGNANVFLVFVGANQNYSVFDALAFAITENIAPVVSVSYGACELAISQNALDETNALFEQAAAQGQTIVAASGDLGSTTCANYPSSTGVTTVQQALSLSFPASSPYVTAVGGTQMATGTFEPGSSAYWQQAATADATSSLLSYVPEVVWNEGSVSHGIVAGGGGASAYYKRPAWQSGVPGIPGGPYRLVPDIALQSSITTPGFLICTSDSFLMGSGQTSSCSNGLKGNNGQYTVAGGTSFAAPIFAGFVAMLNEAQNAAGGQGNINPVLYKLAADPATYAAVFHDITSGSNACVAGASGCSTVGQSNYAAGVGYDEATGLGSLNFNALVASWPAGPAAKLRATRLSLVQAMTQPSPGQTVIVQIFLQPADSSIYDPNPMRGTLSFWVDGVAADAPRPVQQVGNAVQAAPYNFIAPTTPGSHLLAVAYSGDANHAPATRTISFMVGNVVPTGSITLSAGNLTVANGSTATTQVTITPAGGYSGRLFWSLSLSGTPSVSACYWLSPQLVNGTSTAQLKIGVGSACSTVTPSERTAVQKTANNEIPVRRQSRSTATVYAGLLLCGLAARRRRPFSGVLWGVAIFTVLGIGLTGCGGGGGSDRGPQGTNSNPPASYTLTLKANDSVVSSITASTSFTVTVK